MTVKNKFVFTNSVLQKLPVPNINQKKQIYYDLYQSSHLPDSVDVQYVFTDRYSLYKEREKNMKYYDVTSLMFNKYNLLTVDELWDFN